MATTPGVEQRRDTAKIRAELAEKFARWTTGTMVKATPIPWLTLIRRTAPTEPCPFVYEPSLAVIIAGRKQVTVGDHPFVYDESRFLLTAVDVPVVSQVLEASEAQPYLAMLLKLDLAVTRQLILEYELQAPKGAPAGRGIVTGPATVDVLGACARLIDLLDTPDDMAVLSELIHREILYRLLKSEQGGRLWQLAMAGSQSHRIQKAITWLRHHFAEPLRVDALADVAAMSVSSMHQHFREITAMSPLQFQKHLRLQEARRLMLVDDLDAGSAALRVGYESASQFSREYHRMFGQPPKRDVQLLRSSGPAGTVEAEATGMASR